MRPTGKGWLTNREAAAKVGQCFSYWPPLARKLIAQGKLEVFVGRIVVPPNLHATRTKWYRPKSMGKTT